VIAAQGSAGTVIWLRNETIHSSACFAAPAPISTSADFGGTVSGGDVDGDGDMDVVSGSSGGAVWLENTAGDGSAWATHTVSELGGSPVSATDMDGDGDLDVLGSFATAPYPSMVWFENTAGNGSAWTAHTISGPFGYILSLSSADIDGDGDLDVVVGRHLFMPYSDIGWWENTAGDGTVWNPHFITGAPVPMGSQAVDLDGDGDLDVLYGAYGGQVVGWAENAVPGSSPWPNHYISYAAAYVSSVIAGDMDGDGDLDAVATSDAHDDYLVWYENTAGNGGAWATRTITTAMGGSSVFGADLDKDGDVDLVLAARNAGSVTWFENSGNGSTWTAHTVASVPSPASAFAADVDGDGREDAISASYTNDVVAWHPNRGGQFSLAGSDMAPAVAPDSALVPTLRLDAAHLGRTGDHQLELASLGLLFEQAPGAPLTTSEANALVESLRVYRDENGNGAFDPAADTLVVSLPTLFLAGGVQTLLLPDGDPTVEVSPGAPRTFFVVAELTPNASQQAPNHFRVTHLGLGPLASTAEDRDFDFPLRPACPADFASGIVSAGQAAFAVRATKTVSGVLREGGSIAYLVTLTNLGTNPQPDTAQDELVDTAPAGITVTGADDGADPGTVSVAGNTVRWNGAIPASASVAVTIQATVDIGTAGSVIANQGTIAYDSDGNGTGDATHPTDDPALPGAGDPTSFVPGGPARGDLVHGSDRVLDIAGSGVGVDIFGFRQDPRSSYEVVVDGTTGDIGSGGSGPALDLVAADATTVLASSVPAGAGPSRSLRFENAGADTILDQAVRLRSLGCTTGCTAEDRYRVRAWETTLRLARLNNSGTQITVLVLQNTTADPVTGTFWLRDAGGGLVAGVAFSIPPHGTIVQNTAALAPGVGGSLSISHDAPYGALAGKAVAVEPATGFTFDTPLVLRPR
jgi:FG-GAP-like repeat